MDGWVMTERTNKTKLRTNKINYNNTINQSINQNNHKALILAVKISTLSTLIVYFFLLKVAFHCFLSPPNTTTACHIIIIEGLTKRLPIYKTKEKESVNSR